MREAVIASNTHPGPDTILLKGGKVYSLTLATGTTEDNASFGDLDILGTVTITHSPSRKAEANISANHIDRVFNLPAGTGGKLTLSKVDIQSGLADYGGGIYVQHGSLKLVHSSVFVNSTNFADGGGIAVSAGASAKIVDSVIGHNQAAGEGGGILNDGRLKMVDSEVNDNTSVISGGGVTNFGKLTMRNDTVAGNKTQGNGGGISSVGIAFLNDDTIADNKADSTNLAGYMGGGLYAGSGTFTISNSLIANNRLGSGAGAADKNCFGLFVSAGNNMRTSHDPGCTGFTSKGDFVNPHSKIGGLTPCGSTGVIPLLKGSPAIGKASPKTSEKTDQCGTKRAPKHPDIGAYEAPG